MYQITKNKTILKLKPKSKQPFFYHWYKNLTTYLMMIDTHNMS